MKYHGGEFLKKILRKRDIQFASVLFLLFLAVTYWSSIVKFLGTLISEGKALLIGCVIAYIVNLILKQYEHLYTNLVKPQPLTKLKRPLCLLLAYASIIVIVALLLQVVVPELIQCIQLLFSNNKDSAIYKLIRYLENNSLFKEAWQKIDLEKLAKNFTQNDLIKDNKNWTKYLSTLKSAASTVGSILTTTVVAIFFSVYVLLFKEKVGSEFNKVMDAYLPKKVENHLKYVIGVFDNSYSSYITGQFKDAILLGIMCFIGMSIFRFPYAAMVSAVISFTALIPIIGAILGATVGFIVIFATSPFKALMFLVFIVVLQQIDNRITYPLVVGKSLGLPSIWVFTAVMIGGGLSGIIGMMVTVPLFAALYQLIKDDVKRRKEKLPIEK